MSCFTAANISQSRRESRIKFGPLLDSGGGFVTVARVRRTLALATVLLGGCGPVEYLNQVSGRAATALRQARHQGAERHAPFEYTAASEYLHKAREEAGHSSYQIAIEYGRRAEELAGKAEAIAREKAGKAAAVKP